MPGKYVQCEFMKGKYNNYLIAGNVCNAFAIGEIGSSEDFFLVGAEPAEESNYPLLTGNFLDSEGNVLFRLVRNVLVVNPGHCSRILSDHVGYEICDSSGKLVLAVRTVFERLPGATEETFVTTLKANCHDKSGKLVLQANSGEPDEELVTGTKCAIGFSPPGSFGVVQCIGEKERSFLACILMTRGVVHEQLTGCIEGGAISLDGKALVDCNLLNCTIDVARGEFVMLGKTKLENCKIKFSGMAQNVRNLVLKLQGQE